MIKKYFKNVKRSNLFWSALIIIALIILCVLYPSKIIPIYFFYNLFTSLKIVSDFYNGNQQKIWTYPAIFAWLFIGLCSVIILIIGGLIYLITILNEYLDKNEK